LEGGLKEEGNKEGLCPISITRKKEKKRKRKKGLNRYYFLFVVDPKGPREKEGKGSGVKVAITAFVPSVREKRAQTTNTLSKYGQEENEEGKKKIQKEREGTAREDKDGLLYFSTIR